MKIRLLEVGHCPRVVLSPRRIRATTHRDTPDPFLLEIGSDVCYRYHTPIPLFVLVKLRIRPVQPPRI